MGTIEHAAATLTGRRHSVTQDAVIEPLELPGGLILAGAFDGISGYPGGEEASRTAAGAVRERAGEVLSGAGSIRDALISLTELANGAVLGLQGETGGRMGTTMTLCLLDTASGKLHVANVGDSVLLRVRAGEIIRLNAEDVDARGRLTRWLGQPRPLDADGIYSWSGAADGDRFVLGTDGFLRGRKEEDCLLLLQSAAPLPAIAKRLAETGSEVSSDDISVILMDYHQDGGQGTTPVPPPKDDNEQNHNAMKINTKSGGFALFIVLALLLAGFVRLYSVQEKRFPGPDEAFTISAHAPAQSLAAHLNRPERIADPGEASFIAGHIMSKVPADGRPLTTLSGRSAPSARTTRLNFSCALDSAGRAAIGGYPYLSARLEAWDREHGVGDAALSGAIPADTGADAPDGKLLKVRVRIVEKGRLPLIKTRVADTVLIRVRQHWMEYEATSDGRPGDGAARDSVYRVVKAAGGAATLVLPAKDSAGNRLYYSVLPVDPKGHYAFGTEKGTYRGGRRMAFVRTRAFLMPLGKDVVRDIREKGDITVRTPEQYRATLFGLFLLLAAVWTAAYLSVRARDVRLGRRSDHQLIVAAAGITGFGILTLLGIPQAPLTDDLKAVGQMVKGILPGVVALILASRVDWERFYERDRQAYRNKAWQGALLAGLAVLVSLALLLFGSGPGGARINLLFFQGQPLIKCAVIGYLSIYLANRTEVIPAYAGRDNRYDRVRHASLVAKMTVLLVGLLFAQVVFLHDMGPGVVLVLGTVICYSICRRDAFPTVVGAASFLLFAWAWNTFIGKTFTLAVPLVWTAAWVVACRAAKGQVYESAIPVVFVIAALLYGGLWLDAVGLHEAGARLSDRVACWQAPFDSHTSSDQLAMAIYDYAEGGLTGRAGHSLAYLTPEANSDFIYAAAVSEWGLVGAVLFICLLAVVLTSGAESAIRNRNSPFCFYLGACIVCFTATQAIFILGANTLLWPVSGVPLWGLNVGATSLNCDLFGLGVLIALSRGGRPVGEADDDRWTGWSKNVVGLRVWTLVAMVGLLAVLGATSVYSVFRRDHYLTRITVNPMPRGGCANRYAPTIEQFVRDSLRAGDILDRNGAVLATDGPRGVRLYPAGDGAFFWTGNGNNGALRDRTDRYAAGPLADYRWDMRLRGFKVETRPLLYVTTELKPPFLPEAAVNRIDTLYTRDYSGVLPYWKSPRKTRQWNENPDEHAVVVTLDLTLLESLTRAAREFFAERDAITARTRFSGVVIDAVTGEVLCSVCLPIYDGERLNAMAEAHVNVYRDDVPGFRAFPDMDLGCCYATPPGSVIKLFATVAGFRKIGSAMADHTERVAAGETIYSHEPSGLITLMAALWKSSNLYFIHALNVLDLYADLADLFWSCGVSFEGRLPYFLYSNTPATDRNAFRAAFSQAGDRGRERYHSYVRSGKVRKLKDMEWTMAWGGGSVAATPLAVARLHGAIANQGELVHSRFCLDDPVIRERLLPAADAMTILDSMKPLQGGGSGMRMKTGTAERPDALSPSKKSNDAWVTVSIDGSRNPKTGHPLVFTVRFERVGDATSSLAVDFVREKMVPVLQNRGYLSRLQ